MIRVLGLGNMLMSDDGFGPYVVRVLDAFYEFPDDVQVLDVATPGLVLAPFLVDTEAVFLVDTVKANGTAGDIRIYDRADILGRTPQARVSPYDPALKEALLTAAASGAGPVNVKLFGVIPDWVAPGVHLSRNVRSAVAPIIGLVITELEHLGARPKLRPTPRRPDTWWESGEVSQAALRTIAEERCRKSGTES